jgi:hypothetical protein
MMGDYQYVQDKADVHTDLPKDVALLEKKKKDDPLYTGMMHWNQDPNSIPSPLSGGTRQISSTQARYAANNMTDEARDYPIKEFTHWGDAMPTKAAKEYN